MAPESSAGDRFGVSLRPPRTSCGPDFPREHAIRTALLALPALALGLTACSSTPAPRAAASPAGTAATPLSPTPTDSVAVPRPTPTATRTATPRPSRSTQIPDDPLSPGPPLESAPPLGAPTCAPAALAVTDADAVYTAEFVQELFTVRTTGPDCQLPNGYPEVLVLDAAGGSLGRVAQGGFGLPAPGGVPVTLSRATSLSFFVATKRDGTCVPAATLVVTMPGTTTALRTATAMQVCDRALAAGPVQRLGDHE